MGRSRCLACPLLVGAQGRWRISAVTVRFGVLFPANVKITLLLNVTPFNVVEV